MLDRYTVGDRIEDAADHGDLVALLRVYDTMVGSGAPTKTGSGVAYFVKHLDTSIEVVVYAQLPRGLLITTQVGAYNPDWAISFKEGTVKHLYFVAETKGSMSSIELREIERTKLKCSRKFFDDINRKLTPEQVKYDVVDSFGKLIELVS